MFIIGHLRGRSGREVFPIRGNDTKTNIEIIGATDIKALTINKNKRAIVLSTKGLSSCLSATDYKTPKQIIVGNVNPSGKGMNGNVFDSQGLAPTLTTNKGEGNKIAIPVLTPDRIEKRQNGRRFKEDGEPMFTLTAQGRHDVAIKQRPRGNNKGGNHNIAPTLTSNSWHENNFLDTGFRIRKLTPKECFRLQGFPDEYFERAAAVNSDSQLYKQAGNSVTVNVIYEIAKRL